MPSGAVKVPGQVEQFAANLQRRQGCMAKSRGVFGLTSRTAERRRTGAFCSTSSVSAQPPHAAEVAEHAAGQQGEPIAAVPQEGIERRLIPGDGARQ